MTHTSNRTRTAVTKAQHRNLPTTRDRILFALGVAAMFLLIFALNLAPADRPLHGAAPSIAHENVHA